ncbi:predicted protein [Sclerotinia sclerotiorum 1980 UF-70]|uniref:Aminoglycoside phosphotransferase domain-containing protein n=1 Tax=Sclerotinia sclerotiorum (strain ATCC 18683 / 1980 / Ss-1) TaxID=665079 RepID=A7EUQ7_SCLS1|nr:predicted protein [Sclerotinia sclerotiorum 1980 UF-70]EDN93199.1 predicted protein [Sclerotinia sclerotiorum 1980 UF-70]
MSIFIDIERVREQAELLTLSRCSFILGTGTVPFRGGGCLVVDFLQVQELGITTTERLIDRYLPLQCEEVPHVLVHNDLCGNNIIVNEKAELQWYSQNESFKQTVYPPFLTHDPTLEGQEINWAARDTETMQRDRAFYLGCIRELALAKGGLVEEYYTNLARKDEIDKYWWFVAATSKSMHKAMVACNWKPPVKYR